MGSLSFELTGWSLKPLPPGIFKISKQVALSRISAAACRQPIEMIPRIPESEQRFGEKSPAREMWFPKRMGYPESDCLLLLAAILRNSHGYTDANSSKTKIVFCSTMVKHWYTHGITVDNCNSFQAQ